MGTCPVGCTEHEHYGARLRAKGVQVSAGALPTRAKFGKIRKPQAPSWEKGIPTEKRPGGFEMPYINEKGHRVRVKEAGVRRHEIAKIRDRQRNAPSSPKE